MFEREKFDYTPLYSDNSNILLRTIKGGPTSLDFPRALHPVLSTLSRRHKDWTFICHSTQKVWVYENGEGLGWVHAYGVNADINFDSRELEYKRSRGRHNHTKDPKKAIKLIEENFKPLSAQEVLSKEVGLFNGMVSSLQYRANQQWASLLNNRGTHGAAVSLSDACYMYALLDAPVPFAEYISNLGFPSGTASEMAELKSNQAFIVAFRDKVKTDNHAVVISRGSNNYLMLKNLDYDHWTLGELPEAYKQNMGFLKLSEVGVPLMDVGIRISENSFFIFVGSNEES